MSDDMNAMRRALREGALVRRADELGTLIVTGSERQSWLNGLVTCDLAPLGPGGGAYGLSVVKSGKILAEVWIAVAADRLYVGALRDRVGLLHQTFERYLIMEDAEVREASGEHGWILAAGPRSAELLEPVRGAAAGVEAGRADWTGLGGAAIVAPSGAVDAVMAALIERGATPTTAAAWDVLRVESNVPRFGVDFDDESYPQEASLEDRAVSFNKGCYLGQETVFMLQMRGHAKKRLVQIAIEGEGDVPAGAEISLPEGGAVGSVTSQVKRPSAPGVLALGYVKYKHAAQGAALQIAGRSATVVGVRSAPC